VVDPTRHKNQAGCGIENSPQPIMKLHGHAGKNLVAIIHLLTIKARTNVNNAWFPALRFRSSVSVSVISVRTALP